MRPHRRQPTRLPCPWDFPGKNTGVNNPPACRRPRFNSWVGNIHRRRDRLPTSGFLGFPCGSAGKESACKAGDLGSIPGLGRSPGEGNGYPLQYSGEFHGQRSLVDYSPRGRKESDTTFTIHYSQLMTFSFTHRATSGQLKAFHPPQFKVRGAQTQRWDFSHLLWGLLPKPGAPEDAKDAPCENQPASLEGFIFSPKIGRAHV